VIGYLGSPLVFWLVIGSGFGSSFRSAGAGAGSNYLEYFFPGTLVLIVLFTSIFGMMTVIEDRKEGFLRSVLVSPIPRSSLVMGKILGSTTLATLQGFLFVLLAPLVGIHLGLLPLILTVGILFLIGLGLTNLGFFIAWRLDSTHGFHALVNLFLIPMWLLSGALFPISGAATWIGWIMRLNPLTYNLAALRRVLYLDSVASPGDIPSLTFAVAITVLFAGVTFLAALRIVGRHGAGQMG
jgi:ABC-2 type transport system permease protein